MRFVANGVDIPELLLGQCDNHQVVFLCGAGVSLDAGIPSFPKLTEQVLDYFEPETSPKLTTAYLPRATAPV